MVQLCHPAIDLNKNGKMGKKKAPKKSSAVDTPVKSEVKTPMQAKNTLVKAACQIPKMKKNFSNEEAMSSPKAVAPKIPRTKKKALVQEQKNTPKVANHQTPKSCIVESEASAKKTKRTPEATPSLNKSKQMKAPKQKKPVEDIEMALENNEEAVSAESHVKAKPSAKKTAFVKSASSEKVAGKRKRDESQQPSGSKKRQMLKLEHEVFVAKLKYSTTKNSIQKHFSQFGEVSSIGLPMNCKTYNKGFAFVAFKEASSLKKALAKSDQQIDSVNIVLNAGEKPAAKEKPNRLFPNELFVGTLDPLTEKPTLEQHFSKCGKVVNVTLPWKKQEGKNKGFGFVSFESAASLKKALEGDHKIDGRLVEVRAGKNSAENGAVSQKVKPNELKSASAVDRMEDDSEEDGDKKVGLEGKEADSEDDEEVEDESDDEEDSDDAVENDVEEDESDEGEDNGDDDDDD